MANVRGFRDLERDQAPRQRAGEQQMGGGMGGGLGGMMQGDFEGDSPLPPLSQVLCPSYKISLRNFIFTMSVIQVVYFIITLIVAQVEYGAMFYKGNKMLGPGAEVFGLLGAKDTAKIQEGQIYLLLTPVLLHAGIIHILFNLYFQCNFGFRMEQNWGTKRIAIIYWMGGLGGNLLSAAGSPETLSVGASGALFGLLGAQLAYLFMNWAFIPNAGSNACNVVLIIVINFLFGAFDGGVIDNFAHLGGLIGGALFGLAYVKKEGGWLPEETKWQKIGIALSCLYFGLTTILLYSTVKV